MKKKFYRVAEMAAEAGIHPDTVRNLERAGIISAQRDRNGHRRFALSECEKLLKYLNLERIR